MKSSSLANVAGAGNTTDADVGELITYTYTVQNVGNVAINNVAVNDVHEGTALPVGTVKNETLAIGADGPLAADGITSTDVTANNGIWSVLQPGATITFTYVHTVTQTEFNNQ